MGYKCQNFCDGQILKAENLNCIERGIESLADSSSIVCESSGEIIVVSDASNRELNGLSIYGRTTQNGTPSPDAPVALENVGSDGTIDVTVCGKNLHNEESAKSINSTAVLEKVGNAYRLYSTTAATWSSTQSNLISLKAGKTYTFSYELLRCDAGAPMLTLRGVDYLIKASIDNKVPGMYSKQYTPTEDIDVYVSVFCTAGTEEMGDITFSSVQLEEGDTATAYEPYKGQTLTVSTPNGLPGVPVSSGGNYTDEAGQQWVCDELDLARGKYIQRVGQVDFADLQWFLEADYGMWRSEYFTGTVPLTPLLCETVPYYRIGIAGDQLGTNCNGPHNLWVRNGSTVNAPTGKALYQLAEPIETALSAEELAAYASLHTNKPNTTVYNDSCAHMALKYNADTKTYIDQKLAAISTAMLNN